MRESEIYSNALGLFLGFFGHDTKVMSIQLFDLET